MEASKLEELYFCKKDLYAPLNTFSKSIIFCTSCTNKYKLFSVSWLSKNVKESFMYFIKKTFEYVQKNRLIFSIICSEKHSISLGRSFISAVEAYCFSKISLVLPKASKESLEIFSSFYSNAFIGVIKWYVLHDRDYPLEKIYDFLERRVDELCSYYEKAYFNEN